MQVLLNYNKKLIAVNKLGKAGQNIIKALYFALTGICFESFPTKRTSLS